jgi:hypothetical protein
MPKVDKLKWRTVSIIQKWYDPNNEIAEQIRSGKITIADAKRLYRKNLLGEYVKRGNIILCGGATLILQLLTGVSGVNPLNNANAQICVSNNNSTPSPSQSNLGGTQSACLPMNSGYPTVSGNTATFQATASTSQANFCWYMWGLFNGTTYLNAVQVNMGTKTSNETWTITVKLQVST